MTGKKDYTDKFEFGIDFQWGLIQYITTDKNGYKALELVEHHYFELMDQQVVIRGLKKFFKAHHRIPSDIILAQELKTLFKGRDYAQSLTTEDRTRIVRKAKSMYSKPVKDGDIYLMNCINFRAHIKLKKVLEKADISDFNTYTALSKQIQDAINTGSNIKEGKGLMIVDGAKTRIMNRKMQDDLHPTPYWQINKWTSAGGYKKGSVLCFIDRPKKGKTVFLVNTARGYMRLRKKVLFVDLENGESAIGDRVDQSLMKAPLKEIMGDMHDEKLLKIFRKYKRIGAELVIKRLPAYVTTSDDIESLMDYYYQEFGIVFEVLIVDYVALMGSKDGDKDDKSRISKAYLDIKNLAEKRNIDTVWTGHHVKREAYPRRESRYKGEDTANCIEINRHVDGMFGLQQTQEEELEGVLRIEVIEQRQGKPDAQAYMWQDINIQRMDEFSRIQRQDCDEARKSASPLKPEESKTPVKRGGDL